MPFDKSTWTDPQMAAPSPREYSAETMKVVVCEPGQFQEYDQMLAANEQPSTVPQAVKDAMRVREEIFDLERASIRDLLFDTEDYYCCHMVLYSKGKPIGTAKLIPYPHGPHPLPDREYWWGKASDREAAEARANVEAIQQTHYEMVNRKRLQLRNRDRQGSFSTSPQTEPIPRFLRRAFSSSGSSSDSFFEETALFTAMGFKNVIFEDSTLSLAPDTAGRGTSLSSGKEQYIRLGRVCILPHYRQLSTFTALVHKAIQWISKNPTRFDARARSLGMGVGEDTTVPLWTGLLCVYAREQEAHMWTRCGFSRDQNMGTWKENSMVHLGMFRRLEIPRKNFQH